MKHQSNVTTDGSFLIKGVSCVSCCCWCCVPVSETVVLNNLRYCKCYLGWRFMTLTLLAPSSIILTKASFGFFSILAALAIFGFHGNHKLASSVSVTHSWTLLSTSNVAASFRTSDKRRNSFVSVWYNRRQRSSTLAVHYSFNKLFTALCNISLSKRSLHVLCHLAVLAVRPII